MYYGNGSMSGDVMSNGQVDMKNDTNSVPHLLQKKEVPKERETRCCFLSLFFFYSFALLHQKYRYRHRSKKGPLTDNKLLYKLAKRLLLKQSESKNQVAVLEYER